MESTTTQGTGMKEKDQLQQPLGGAPTKPAENEGEKNTTTQPAGTDTTGEQMTPLEKLGKRIREVCDRYHIDKYEVERGASRNDDEDEEEEEEVEEGEGTNKDKPVKKKAKSELTEEEIAPVRYVLITDRREKFLEKMKKAVLRDQAGDSVLMFNTTFSYDVMETVQKQLKNMNSHHSYGEKFDHLFALTKAISRYDAWLYDYEDEEGLQKMITSLGKKWKLYLSHSNEELEIDPEFTRPGVEVMLENFAKKVKEANGNFIFRPFPEPGAVVHHKSSATTHPHHQQQKSPVSSEGSSTNVYVHAERTMTVTMTTEEEIPISHVPILLGNAPGDVPQP